MEKNNHRGKKKKKGGYLMKERLSKAKWLKTFKKDEGWKIVFKN